jgi:4a-hydroxytetrahydrobiopterin dehydratase
VPDADLSRFLAALPAWRLSSDGSSLSRRFVARNFVAALAYLNLVGELAESERHHPDLHITDYRTVEVVVATHEGGARVTMADLVLAAKIDALPWSDYSPKWLREQQAASGGG